MIQYDDITSEKITTIETAAQKAGMKKGAPGIMKFVKEMNACTGLNKDTIVAIMSHEIGEQWAKLSTRFNKYKVSNYGRVMGQRGTIMSTYMNGSNIETFDPYDKDRKRAHIYVKNAVSSLFLKMKKNEVAQYKSETKRHNTVHNLEIVKASKR